MVNPAKIAALFPGQGSQTVGMGQDLAERWPSAAAVFEAIDQGLETNLSGLCWNGPVDDLKLTENTQPALLAHSAAAWTVLSSAGIEVGVAGPTRSLRMPESRPASRAARRRVSSRSGCW